MRLTSVDAAAAKLGLHPGKALADARSMVLDLAVIRADPAADRKLLEAIADWCVRYTPLVALDPPHGLFLDITGASHLYDSEESMVRDVGRA
ncbi:MAG TPA: DNA polymerase Y family protein, partial [Rhizomicrobium sp.]|nr:DNA polymerase Y family protein [Rhizomicrobium sp.]